MWGGSSSNNINNQRPGIRPVKPQSTWKPWRWFTDLIRRSSASSSWNFQWKDNQNYGYFLSSLINRPGRSKVVLESSDDSKPPDGILAQYRQFCKDIAEAIIAKIYNAFTSLFS